MSDTCAILIDTTRCTGCEKCVQACKEVKDLGADLPRPWKQRIDALSSTRLTTVLRKGDHNIRRLCRHCLEPACVSACLVGALQKRENGAVTYDSDRCMGCRYCMMACPYGVPRYSWEDAVPFVRKCDMCFARQQGGRIPACVEACPYEATSFGRRDEILAEAHRRIRETPDRYQPKVYGESEIGGTSVLYVSDIDLGFLAYRDDLPEKPLPQLTWEALSKVPSVAAGVGGGMTLLWWIINRRMKVQVEGEGGEEQVNS